MNERGKKSSEKWRKTFGTISQRWDGPLLMLLPVPSHKLRFLSIFPCLCFLRERNPPSSLRQTLNVAAAGLHLLLLLFPPSLSLPAFPVAVAAAADSMQQISFFPAPSQFPFPLSFSLLSSPLSFSRSFHRHTKVGTRGAFTHSQVTQFTALVAVAVSSAWIFKGTGSLPFSSFPLPHLFPFFSHPSLLFLTSHSLLFSTNTFSPSFSLLAYLPASFTLQQWPLISIFLPSSIPPFTHWTESNFNLYNYIPHPFIATNYHHHPPPQPPIIMTGTEAVTSPTEPKKDEKTAIEGGEDAAAASPKKAPAPPKPTVHKTNWEQDTVYLYQFPRVPTLPSVSAYCLKVENYLRMTGIKYEVRFFCCCFHWQSLTTSFVLPPRMLPTESVCYRVEESCLSLNWMVLKLTIPTTLFENWTPNLTRTSILVLLPNSASWAMPWNRCSTTKPHGMQSSSCHI